MLYNQSLDLHGTQERHYCRSKGESLAQAGFVQAEITFENNQTEELQSANAHGYISHILTKKHRELTA